MMRTKHVIDAAKRTNAARTSHVTNATAPVIDAAAESDHVKEDAAVAKEIDHVTESAVENVSAEQRWKLTRR